MTRLSAVLPSSLVSRVGPDPVRRRRRFAAAIIVVVVATAATALIFGPARGARNDISHVRQDLHYSRSGISATVRTLTDQLKTTEQSLVIQQRGLSVATDSQQVAHVTSGYTAELLQQTTTILDTIKHVLAALGPLPALQGKLSDIAFDANAAVSLARSTLDIARQTLATGQTALQIAVDTLDTLRQSRAIEQALLDVAKQTLTQTQQLNAKIPLPPIFPTAKVSSGR